MKNWVLPVKNWVWRHRITVGLLVLLVVQTPFVWFKVTTPIQHSGHALVETLHVLVSSGLAGYLFSKAFDSLLEDWLYGRFLRRSWKEFRVVYSDDVFKGMGDAYPRDPTLLIQPPFPQDAGPVHLGDTPGDLLAADSLDGKSRIITAMTMHGPMSVSFNSGYLGEPAVGDNTWVTGKWSDLQLMQVGSSGHKMTRVGFPDTLIEQRKA